MLLLKLPTKRKVVPIVAIGGPYNLGQHEYLRRDRLIRSLADNCGYKYGDVVRPVDDETYEKMGCYTVLAICNGWYSYKGQEKRLDSEIEWVNDNPRIVQAMSKKNGVTVEATTNYFKLATKEEAEHADKTSNC